MANKQTTQELNKIIDDLMECDNEKRKVLEERTGWDFNGFYSDGTMWKGKLTSPDGRLTIGKYISSDEVESYGAVFDGSTQGSVNY